MIPAGYKFIYRGNAEARTKKWYRSRTINANIIVLIGVLLSRYAGITLTAEETAAVLAVINLVLRAATKTGLTT